VVGAGEVSGVGEDPGEDASNGVVAGMLVVQLLDEGQGLVLVLTDEDGGELGGEGGIVGGLLEGGAEEGFGFRVLLPGDEEMGEIGSSGFGVGVFGEDAAVGGFSHVVLACVLRDVGA
jgi:hypothetical protein